MLYLTDTNILLRLLEPRAGEYFIVRRAVEILLAQGHTLCLAPQNMVEFWNVCTRPADRNGLGLTVSQTDQRARLLEGSFSLLVENERVHTEWRRLVVEHSVAGVQVHDARLVAAMLVHGVTHILTLNPKDSSRYPDITTLLPDDVVGAGA